MTEMLFRDDPYCRRCEAKITAQLAGGVLVDRTVFYPTGGGQPGDCGTLVWQDGEIPITGAIKHDDGAGVLHLLAEGAVPPPTGSDVWLGLDWQRRHRLMRMHTSLHLLCSLVEGDVTGGQVGAEKSRLDFNVPAGSIDKAALEDGLNSLISAGFEVRERWISDAELAAQPDLVRTLSVKPPAGGGRVRLLQIGSDAHIVDLQPCGGTHVANTSEIGPVRIGKIENKGKQNRRINLSLVAP